MRILLSRPSSSSSSIARRTLLRASRVLFLNVLVCAVVASLGVVRVEQASAALDIKWYSFASSGPCSTWVDPITVIFYNDAESYLVENHFNYHVGWGDVILGDEVEPQDQYYWSNSTCYVQQIQKANGSAWNDRFHIRWRQGNYTDATYGYFTMATPHYEFFEDCPGGWTHVPDWITVGSWSGYDEGRRAIYNAMDGPHYTEAKDVGNSAYIEKCGGTEMIASNGWVRYVRITLGTGH